ncbi:Hsp70 family protein [Paenactinomyces guangxiensis]|uniref:Chaperone protein DnaK n=1 Tax=Paenactinomyces guangxiensis TaxID=1490290 RepID=A0A7W1WTW8_9BACL|nr:Hsp70 family protein [Paenactinomyces guangxiensis]MBA4495791.1 Hsp70 family protein [Paenactinomyces guangxiensis]MBH8592881.1 Hsp70 family protein [Paenactinomyces guangxiensis]
MGKVVGIDLGTTYSAVAIVNKYGKPEMLTNREGERITPSVVLFDGEDPIVGSIAKRSAVASPFNVIQFVKRQIGDKNWKFRTENAEAYTPEEISAMILRRLKEDAEMLLGEKVEDAVITVPAYFDDAQRKATQDAGRIAGINVLRIINEPTAAALAYGLDKMDQEQTILVYDLGGGTFDVTIMRLSPQGLRVLSTGGAKNLGGFDWDNAIMNYLNEEFKKQGGIDLLDDPMLEQDLRDKAEIAKKTLSSRDRTNVFLSAQGINLSIPLTRIKFEELTGHLLNQTQKIMEFVLEDAGLEWKDIDRVLLVGGSTRMKAVPALIERVTGIKPSLDVNPDEVVAMGAAIQGTILHLKEGKASLHLSQSFPIVEVQDVNSHSMGVVALDENGKEVNSIVLKKDTVIPSRVSGHYTTTIDRQTQLHLQVTEGEDTDLDYVKIVGEGIIGLPEYPKGAPLEVIFEYDSDGIIHVSVIDSTANTLLGELDIERTSNLTEEEVKEKQIRVGKLAIS